MKTTDDVSEIYPALIAAQAEMSNPKKDANNPFFRSQYVQLPTLLKAVRPILAEHDLGMIQCPSLEDDTVSTRLRLIHKSGQHIEWEIPVRPRQINKETGEIIPKTDPQGVVAANTYVWKRLVEGALNICATTEDDDANMVSVDDNAAAQSKPPGVAANAERKRAASEWLEGAKTTLHALNNPSDLAAFEEGSEQYIDALKKYPELSVEWSKVIKNRYEAIAAQSYSEPNGANLHSGRDV